MPDRPLYQEIEQFFSEHLNISVPSVNTDLFDAGILDSLTFVDLVLHLEQEFDIHIGAEELELENFRSIEKIAAFATAHSGLQKAGAA
ncbi:MAG TPA: acyl carrier protein [Bryobacteraceae bacterium]|nr:acyl carrier protein [Bryobacteraceae bacterium]